MGKNQVTITFAGDEKDLVRSSAAIEQSNKALGASFDKVSQQAVDASRRMDLVASAGDEVNDLGDKTTSSLGALSSGFDLVGASSSGAAAAMGKAALAADVLAGVSEATVIATSTMGSVVERAKEAWAGFNTTAKAATISMGAIGIALAAVGVAYAIMSSRAAEAEARQADVRAGGQELVDTLDEETGALTKATRAQILKDLQQDYSIQNAERLGISTRTLVDSLMGQADATAAVSAAVDENNRITEFNNATSDEARKRADERIASANYLRERLDLEKDKLAEANEVWAANSEVLAEATQALQDYAKATQDQFDPMANLVHRLEDVSVAQAAYNDAVEEHGVKSAAAKDANLALAEAILGASGAAAAASGSFDGTLTPALRNILKAGGMTEKQINDIERSFINARKAGDNYSKTYKATAILEEFRTYREGERNPAGGRASGGPTVAGSVYEVGEHGKELWMETRPGYMFNAAQTAAILSGQSGGGQTWSGAPAAAPAASGFLLGVRGGGAPMDDLIVQVIERAWKSGRLTLIPTTNGGR